MWEQSGARRRDLDGLGLGGHCHLELDAGVEMTRGHRPDELEYVDGRGRTKGVGQGVRDARKTDYEGSVLIDGFCELRTVIPMRMLREAVCGARPATTGSCPSRELQLNENASAVAGQMSAAEQSVDAGLVAVPAGADDGAARKTEQFCPEGEALRPALVTRARVFEPQSVDYVRGRHQARLVLYGATDDGVTGVIHGLVSTNLRIEVVMSSYQGSPLELAT